MRISGTSRDHHTACHRLVRVLVLLVISVLLYLVFKEYFHNHKTKVTKHAVGTAELGCFYTVTPPVNPIAWEEITILIIASPGGLCQSYKQHNITVGESRFRVQAFGSQEMVAGEAIHLGNDTYQAKLRVSFAGDYVVMVILTFANNAHLEYRFHSNAILQHVFNSPFEMRVAAGPSPAGYTRYCTKEESGTAPGRWVECGKLAGIEDCGAWQLNSVYDFDQIHGFHWVPYACQLHHYSNDEIKKCFAQNGWSNIAFTG